MEDMEKKLAVLLARSPHFMLKGGSSTYRKAAKDFIANGMVIREKGEWVFEEYEKMPWCTKAVCSCCKGVIANNVHLSQLWGQKDFVASHNFCPNCGADMRKR